MPADGISYSNRVTDFNTSKVAAATVVDTILDSTTLASRFLGMGKSFSKSTLKRTIKVSTRSGMQWVSGGEQLRAQAENVTAQMEYNPNFGTHEEVDLLVEAFSRYEDQDIDFDGFNYEDTLDTIVQGVSSAFYGTGVGDQFLGLEAIVDDGTNNANIGGLSRSTYSGLNSTVTTFTTLALSKMATMVSTVSDTERKDKLTSIMTTTDIVDFFEQLLNPTVRHEQVIIPVRGKYPVASFDKIGMSQGWNAYTYKGIPLLADKQANPEIMYFLNENYVNFHGKTKAPGKKWAKYLKPVTLPGMTKESYPGDRPSNYHGFFYQESQVMPNQGACIARFWVVGQLVTFNPRRHGKGTAIAGI